MGFFDFLRPKQDQPDWWLKEKDPQVRKAYLWGTSEFVAKQADNLRAVGRNSDADKTVGEFLAKIFQEFKNDPQNPSHLSFLTNIALKLGALDAGKQTLQAVIKENEHLSLDLTLVYTDLGRIYHDLMDPDRELWCYEKAAQVKAPPDCKFPATRQQKARAHYFAYSSLSVMSFAWEFYLKKRGAGPDQIARAREEHRTDEQRATSHIQKARELVPEVNWDDESQVIKFMQSK